jgi:hypothetical protein
MVFAVAGAGLALAAVDRNPARSRPRASATTCAHAERRARGGVDLVAVVGLVDLDIHLVAEHAGGHLHQLKHRLTPVLKLEALHTGMSRGGGLDLGLLRRGEAGGADDHGDPAARAGIQIGEGGRRHGEIDQHVDGIDHLRQRTHHRSRRCALARPARPHRRPSRLLSGRSTAAAARSPSRQAYGLDQGAAHAPAGAGNTDPDSHGFMSSKKFLTPSNQLLCRGDWA